jgi:hypothetical protein
MITKDIALSLRYRDELVHRTERDSRGLPARCRVNGACVTWKTRPFDFKLPVKYGLAQCFYITERNAEQWSLPSHRQL